MTSLRRARPVVLLLSLAAFLLAAAACANVASPQGWAPPVRSDDTLYVSIERGKLAALNVSELSAAPKWVFPPDTEQGKKIKLEAVYGAPVLNEGRLYFGAYDGKVYALDPANGNRAWEFDTGEPVIAGVAVSSGSVFAASDGGQVFKLNGRDGTLEGSFDAGGSVWATPLINDTTIYIPTVEGRLYALKTQDFSQVWEKPLEADAGLLTDPVLGNESTLIVGGIDRRIRGVDIATGREKWSFKGGNWFWGKPLVADGKVFAPNLDSRVYALDVSTGKALWQDPFEAAAEIHSSPVLAGGALVIVDKEGNAYGVDPASGNGKWIAEALQSRTVLADPIQLNDRVLILAQGGDLFRVDPSGGGNTQEVVRQR